MVELKSPTEGAQLGKMSKTIVTLVNDDGELIADVLLNHYENTPMQYAAIFKGFKNGNFQMKNCDIFPQNIDCGYTLEPA